MNIELLQIGIRLNYLKEHTKLRNNKTPSEFLSDFILKMTNNQKMETKDLC